MTDSSVGGSMKTTQFSYLPLFLTALGSESLPDQHKSRFIAFFSLSTMISHTARRMKSFQKHKASENLLSQRYLNGHGHKTNARCCVYGMRLLFSGPFNSFCVKLFLLLSLLQLILRGRPRIYETRGICPSLLCLRTNLQLESPGDWVRMRRFIEAFRKTLGLPLARLLNKIRLKRKINKEHFDSKNCETASQAITSAIV